MADDETLEDTLVSQEVEEAATGRRWGFSLAMVILGIVGVATGVLFGPTILILCGVVVILVFGCIAAGSSGVDVSGPGGIRAKAPFPRKTKRRKIVRKSGFPKQGRSPAEPEKPEEPSD